MYKVILFYKFTPVADTVTVKLWQRTLCEKYGLKGRILLNEHGINGTLNGDLKGLKMYVRAMNEHPSFRDITYKWSEGKGDEFPRLSVKVRSELVAFGSPESLVVDENGVVGGGTHLKPEEVHALVAERGDDVVFFDGRNAYEAEVGRFKNAIVPNVRHTRDFAKELDDPKYDTIKNKPVVTYCTGGIRCEVLSSLMKQKGFTDVYQMDGGIVKYGETYKDDGLWEGKLYVFDDRLVTPFSDKAKDIGSCVRCTSKTSNFENCASTTCNDLVLICESCLAPEPYCSLACEKVVA
jgi:UPF0176 protein